MLGQITAPQSSSHPSDARACPSATILPRASGTQDQTFIFGQCHHTPLSFFLSLQTPESYSISGVTSQICVQFFISNFFMPFDTDTIQRWPKIISLGFLLFHFEEEPQSCQLFDPRFGFVETASTVLEVEPLPSIRIHQERTVAVRPFFQRQYSGITLLVECGTQMLQAAAAALVIVPSPITATRNPTARTPMLKYKGRRWKRDLSHTLLSLYIMVMHYNYNQAKSILK